MGKLFIIEGIDGSGKTTQSSMLIDYLKKDGHNAIRVKFPCYGEKSCTLVNMYLSGEFGSSPDSVNAYAATCFFAVDRYSSYKLSWGEHYNNGGIIVSDRYTTSNILHQGSKLAQNEKLKYFDWLYDFEYSKLGLPRPDGVFFLDVPPDISGRQVESRYHGDESKKDIHEKDSEYLRKCYETGIFACEHGFMTRVQCVANGKMLHRDVICRAICDAVEKSFIAPKKGE